LCGKRLEELGRGGAVSGSWGGRVRIAWEVRRERFEEMVVGGNDVGARRDHPGAQGSLDEGGGGGNRRGKIRTANEAGMPLEGRVPSLMAVVGASQEDRKGGEKERLATTGRGGVGPSERRTG